MSKHDSRWTRCGGLKFFLCFSCFNPQSKLKSHEKKSRRMTPRNSNFSTLICDFWCASDSFACAFFPGDNDEQFECLLRFALEIEHGFVIYVRSGNDTPHELRNSRKSIKQITRSVCPERNAMRKTAKLIEISLLELSIAQASV